MTPAPSSTDQDGELACRDAPLLPSLPKLLPVRAEGIPRHTGNWHQRETAGCDSRHKALWQATLPALHCRRCTGRCTRAHILCVTSARRGGCQTCLQARRALVRSRPPRCLRAPSSALQQRCCRRLSALNGLDVRPYSRVLFCHPRVSGLLSSGGRQRCSAGAGSGKRPRLRGRTLAAPEPRPSVLRPSVRCSGGADGRGDAAPACWGPAGAGRRAERLPLVPGRAGPCRRPAPSAAAPAVQAPRRRTRQPRRSGGSANARAAPAMPSPWRLQTRSRRRQAPSRAGPAARTPGWGCTAAAARRAGSGGRTGSAAARVRAAAAPPLASRVRRVSGVAIARAGLAPVGACAPMHTAAW